MSQTCQAMRQYIMSMSQAGTEPAWPEARTCVSGHVTAPYLCHEEEADVQKVTNYLQVITMCSFFFSVDQIPVTAFPQHCSSPFLLIPLPVWLCSTDGTNMFVQTFEQFGMGLSLPPATVIGHSISQNVIYIWLTGI